MQIWEQKRRFAPSNDGNPNPGDPEKGERSSLSQGTVAQGGGGGGGGDRTQKLLVLDTVVMRRCRVRLCVPCGGARRIGRVGAHRFDRVRCRRRLQP